MSREKNKIMIDDTLYETEIPKDFFKSRYNGIKNSHEIRAIIPGTIAEVRVKEGEKVAAEQVIIILEAMKMLNDVEAGMDGRVAKIKVSVGDRVEKDQIMVMIEG